MRCLELKQAILIIAHNNWDILKNQIDFFSSDLFDIFIHVDKKSYKSFEKYFFGHKLRSNVYIYSEYRVNWGGYSQIKTEIFLFEMARNFNSSYSYYHLLSGVDFPIKSSFEIYNFFDNNFPSNFLTFAHLENDRYDNKDLLIEELLNTKSNLFIERINYHYIAHDFKFINCGLMSRKLSVLISKVQKLLRYRRIKNEDFILAKGSNWVSITEEFVDLILNQKNRINKIYKNSYCADEIYKHTIFVNSNLIQTLYYDPFSRYSCNKREIDWTRGNPYIFINSDLQQLVTNKSQNLFVRKLSEQESMDIITYFTALNEE